MKSRKFIMLIVCVALASLIPVGFKLLQIDEGITKTSLGIIGALASVYFGVNVWQKRIK